MKKFAIGIDAGQKTGCAIYDRQKKEFIYILTGDFWTIFWLIKNHQKPEETLIVIENPGLNKRPIYSRIEGNSQNSNVRENMAMKIGSNRREATLLIEGLKKEGFEVREQKPTSTKWDAEQLKRYTKIDRRTNEHERDAIRLVFGL